MDDNEYYALMRKQNLHRITRTAKAKPGAAGSSKYKNWESFQGREDAEMLVEKKEAGISSIPDDES